MQKINLTAWKKQIKAYCVENGVDKTDSQISRMAVKITKRMSAMNEELEFFEALRILGILSDPTARDAVRNLEAAA